MDWKYYGGATVKVDQDVEIDETPLEGLATAIVRRIERTVHARLAPIEAEIDVLKRSLADYER